MIKVSILQTDTRPLENDYVGKSVKVNTILTTYLSKNPYNREQSIEYKYKFTPMPGSYVEKVYSATAKIFFLNDYLQISDDDVIVFLDSDAWIQTPKYLDQLLHELANNPTKHGCYSRDPYIDYNTYINSGSFLLKVNEYTKTMYKLFVELITNPLTNLHVNSWPYDQHYISKYIYDNKEQFIIFRPEILNTPIGIVLRHNWFKNYKMFSDLNAHITNSVSDPLKSFNFENYYDKEIYPNLSKEGYEYNN